MVLADALIQKKSDALNVRYTQQQIRLSILNAVVALQSAKDSLDLALTEDKFSSLNLDAEHTKYSLGNWPPRTWWLSTPRSRCRRPSSPFTRKPGSFWTSGGSW